MVRIITDSTSDLSGKRQKELGVEVLPLTVVFGEEKYKDGTELKSAEFFKKLEKAERLPTTVQLSPLELEDAFARHVKNGDDVVGIFISSYMSGTYQSAAIARENAGPERIFVVDSYTTTFPLGMLVEQAAKMRDKGMGAAEIAENVKKLSGRLRLFAAVDTLKYLKMGGRLSGAAAFVGGLLGITPIISIVDGRVIAIGKTRGRRAAMEYILNEMNKTPRDLELPIAFAHSNAPALAAEFMEFMESSAGIDAKNSYVTEIGCIVGTHVGPGAVGVAYFEKE